MHSRRQLLKSTAAAALCQVGVAGMPAEAGAAPAEPFLLRRWTGPEQSPPLDRIRVGEFEAIIPSIEGWARVTGHNTIFVDDRDPLARGFLLK